MKNEISIPKPLHIAMDDLGWFCGEDDRKKAVRHAPECLADTLQRITRR